MSAVSHPHWASPREAPALAESVAGLKTIPVADREGQVRIQPPGAFRLKGPVSSMTLSLDRD